MTQTRYWERLISRGALESTPCAARASERNTRAEAVTRCFFMQRASQFFRLPIAVCWKIAQTHKHTHTKLLRVGAVPRMTSRRIAPAERKWWRVTAKGKEERMGVPTPLFLQLEPIYPIYYYSHLQCTSRKYVTVNSLQSWFVAARGKTTTRTKLKIRWKYFREVF